MKKTILAALVVSSAMVSVSAFAAPTKTPAEATVTWSGSPANSIPGDNIYITGENGAKIIPEGELEMNIDGTFTSTPVVVESHEYDESTKVIGNLAEAQWTVKGVYYAWGANDTSKAKLVVKNGVDEIKPNAVIPTASESLSLTVENTKAVDNISDLTADATVAVGLSAAFL